MRQKTKHKTEVKSQKTYSGFGMVSSNYYYHTVSLVLRVCFLINFSKTTSDTSFWSSLLCFFSFLMSLPPKNSSLFQEEKTERLKNREPLIRFKKIMEMVRAAEQEKESYKSRLLFDFENTKEKNLSSSRHIKRWNSDSALRIEDPDIDDDTVFKKTAASSVRPMLPLRPPLVKDELPQPREATHEESQEETGKGDSICIHDYNFFLK